MTPVEPLQITRLVTSVLESLHIRYLVGGSLASSFHGIPRSTQDADIVAELKMEDVPAFVSALESAFYVDAEMIKDAILHHSSFNAIHLATMFKVDVFIQKDDLISRTEMARRERYSPLEEPEQAMFIASPEDTILRKLHWYRMGGEISERQWNDILGVLEIQNKRLDYQYLKDGARQFGVTDLWEKACETAGIELL